MAWKTSNRRLPLWIIIGLVLFTPPHSLVAKDLGQPNRLLQSSIEKHKLFFRKCGFIDKQIEVKINSEIKSKIALIVYSLQGKSGKLRCLLSPTSKTKPVVGPKFSKPFKSNKYNGPILFKSQFDYGAAENVFPLPEGLLKLDSKFLILSAPTSDVGIKGIINVSNEYIIVGVAGFTYDRNYLVSTDLKSISYLTDGDVEVADKRNLIFKTKSKKSYWVGGGAFWYNALINKDGEIIDIDDSVDEKYRVCFPRDEFIKRSNISLPKSGLDTICVEQ